MKLIVTTISIYATIITIIVGIITFIWFVRDVRKQNSKVLKDQSVILSKIEEGQRVGFVTLAEISERGSKTLAQSLEHIEESQNRGFETLAEILKGQSEILARIAVK